MDANIPILTPTNISVMGQGKVAAISHILTPHVSHSPFARRMESYSINGTKMALNHTNFFLKDLHKEGGNQLSYGNINKDTQLYVQHERI